MQSVTLFDIATMGEYHSVASVTGSVMPCCSRSSSFFSFLWYANEIDLGTFAQNVWCLLRGYGQCFSLHCCNLSIEDGENLCDFAAVEKVPFGSELVVLMLDCGCILKWTLWLRVMVW